MQQPPTDDSREAELVQITAKVLVGLILAHQQGDSEAAAVELGRLLQAVAQFTNSLDERASDEPLRRAIGRL